MVFRRVLCRDAALNPNFFLSLSLSRTVRSCLFFFSFLMWLIFFEISLTVTRYLYLPRCTLNIKLLPLLFYFSFFSGVKREMCLFWVWLFYWIQQKVCLLACLSYTFFFSNLSYPISSLLFFFLKKASKLFFSHYFQSTRTMKSIKIKHRKFVVYVLIGGRNEK